jgi:hypothetical protein
MDKHEYKDYKSQIRRREEMEKERRAFEKKDKAYSPFGMTVRMPLGCWIWVAAAIVAAIYFVKRML